MISALDLAWMKGEAIHEAGDRLEDGPVKAIREGYRPGSSTYNAFITAFSKMVSQNAQKAF